MANVTHRIMLAIQARNEAKNELLGFGSQIDRIAGLATAGGILYLGKQIADVTWELAQLGAQAERVDRSFRGMWGTQALDAMQTMREAARGTIAAQDMQLSANRAQLLGVAQTAEELGALMDVARVRGQAMGLSMQQAFDNIVTGLGRASPMILDNLGIIVDAERTYAEYAASRGQAVDALSKEEQVQALTQRVIAESREMVEAQGDTALDAQGHIEGLQSAWADLRTEVGEYIAGEGTVVQAMADGARGAADYAHRVNEVNEALRTFEAERQRASRWQVPEFEPEEYRPRSMWETDLSGTNLAEENRQVRERANEPWRELQNLLGEVSRAYSDTIISEEQYQSGVLALTESLQTLNNDLWTTKMRGGLTQDQFDELAGSVVQLTADVTTGNISQEAFEAGLDGIREATYAVLPPLSEYANVMGGDVYNGIMTAAGAAQIARAEFLAMAADVQAAADVAAGVARARAIQAEKDADFAAWVNGMEAERIAANEARLEGIAAAERDLNWVRADEAGQLSILNNELAKLVPGTEAYIDKLTEIERLKKGMAKGGSRALSDSASELRSMIEECCSPPT